MHYLILGGFFSLLFSGCFTNNISEKSISGDITQNDIAISTNSIKDSDSQFDMIASKSIEREHLATVFYFDYTSSSLDEVNKKILNSLATYLKEHPSQKIVIVGNSDMRGPHEYNQSLGQRRANAVLNYLKSQGVPDAQMLAISKGKENPVSLADNEQTQALNRRTEILFVRS